MCDWRSRSKQMPLTDQITEIAPYVRKSGWQIEMGKNLWTEPL